MASSTDFKRANPTALILCGSTERGAALEALVAICQYDLVSRQSDIIMDAHVDAADFVLVDLYSTSEHFSQSLSDLARYLESHRSTALVWTDMERLEAAYAALPVDQCHFLVDADDVEAAHILAGQFGRDKMNQVHDRGRDLQFSALHRMSDELAGFARTLARIAEQDAGNSPGVADKPVSFRPAPAGSFQPFPAPATPDNADISAPVIRDMIKLRRLRNSYFAQDLFADPAWDILLDLMASDLERRRVSVSSLCIAAAVPPTTALRWITAMTENGLLVRQHDPDDARRVFIGLSDDTKFAMRQYLTDVRRRCAPTV